MISKNRIVILGNGFDIANGLETGFAHFANYYIEKKIIPELSTALTKKDTNSDIFKKTFLTQLFSGERTYTYSNYLDAIWSYLKSKRLDELYKYLKDNTEYFQHILSNSFLSKLYSNVYDNWFDIENAYFFELTQLKKWKQTYPEKFDLNDLIKHNNEFSSIKSNISEYLKSIEITRNEHIVAFFENYFENIENTYIINFNYTSTVRQYVREIRGKGNIQVNHIHGSLEKENIIFGYGNDENLNYEEIKNLEIDEFLEHFKTFEYMNNSNYSKIYSAAIDSFENYEVLVLGHSLGSTDKTLLGEIMNSDKCTKIHLFKRTDLRKNKIELEKSFKKLTFAASRILANEKNLRKKVVNFQESNFFP